MGDIVIRVDVPDQFQASFRQEVEEMAEALKNRAKLFDTLKALRGTMKTEKPWKQLKEEAHEQGIH
jgi:flagellar biosynthesis regulator FlbT